MARSIKKGPFVDAHLMKKVVEAVRTNHQVAPPTTRDLSPAASDLARLLAGIIVALAMEPAHAHG